MVEVQKQEELSVTPEQKTMEIEPDLGNYDFLQEKIVVETRDLDFFYNPFFCPLC